MQEIAIKARGFIKIGLQYAVFALLLFLALGMTFESIFSGLLILAVSLLVLPAVREKFIPKSLRHPLFTVVVIFAVFLFSMEIGNDATVKKKQQKQQEVAEAARNTKEQDLADFKENPQVKIDEIKKLIEQNIYGGARNQIEYYKETNNEELKALDVQLTEVEKKIEAERRAIAEKAAQEQQKLRAAELWSYFHVDDQMSKGVTNTATIQSSNTVNFGFPYSGLQYGRLTLRTDPKYGKDVIIGIEKGQILCPSYNGCKVLVRFDDEDASSFSAVGAADNSTETIFIQNYSRFVEKMMNAQRIRLSMNIYQEGSPVFDFDVSGFNKDKYLSKP